MAGVEGAGRLFRGLAIAASGLSAQRRRIETAAMNIANAETTRTADGTPYQRKVVGLVSGTPVDATSGLEAGSLPVAIRAGELPGPGELDPPGVVVTGVTEDGSEGPLVYDPGHPDANEDGYVRYPNVRVTDELVSMMESRRLYEANATVFDAVKSMLRRATEI